MRKSITLLTLAALVGSLAMVIRPAAAQAADAGGVIALTNQQRAAAGLPALNYNAALTAAAANKANDMIVHQYWSHTSPSGVGPWYWISAAGYPYLYAGENLAQGFSTDDAIVSAWMNSAEHRANILSPNYRDIGCGFASGVLLGQQTLVAVCDYGSTAAELAPAPAPAPVQNYARPAAAAPASPPVYRQPAATAPSAQTVSADQPVAAPEAPAPAPAVPDYYKKSIIFGSAVRHQPAPPAWLAHLSADFGKIKLAAAQHHSFFLGSWLKLW